MEPSSWIGFRTRPSWLLLLLALLMTQGWLTARFFAADQDPKRLLGPGPILDGEHPLHLYHGHLGARTWQLRGTTSCYDPSFQAGYPKTPVFDAGCRFAEVCLVITQGKYQPAYYKCGLALLCLMVPGLVAIAARGLNLSPAAACLASAASIVLWWWGPCRPLLIHGELDFLLAAQVILLSMTWMVRFNRLAGVDSFLVLSATACLGWCLQPIVWLGYLGIALGYYLWITPKQSLGWHVAFLTTFAVGVLVNAQWLEEWARYWWLRVPFAEHAEDWFSPWQVEAWESTRRILADHPLMACMAGAGLLGGIWLIVRRMRACAVLILVSLLLPLGAIATKLPLQPFGSFDALPWLALLGFLSLCPAARLLTAGLQGVCCSGPNGQRLVLPVMLLGLGSLVIFEAMALPRIKLPTLQIGLDANQQDVLKQLHEHTRPSARILWEEPGSATVAPLGPLLALPTQRALIGGLAPQGGVEHLLLRLCPGQLLNRPLEYWGDRELQAFADRYNIGWVACWSEASRQRFLALPGSRIVCPLADGWLIELHRTHSFVLTGQARWVEATPERIILAEVVPDPNQGVVTLSLHYQSRWRVSPNYVEIEGDKDATGPVPLVRLRIPGPVPRLCLTWDDP